MIAQGQRDEVRAALGFVRNKTKPCQGDTPRWNQLSEVAIHLMRTGEVQANLVILNEEFRLLYIADLVPRKLAGQEKSKLEDANIAFHESK